MLVLMVPRTVSTALAQSEPTSERFDSVDPSQPCRFEVRKGHLNSFAVPISLCYHFILGSFPPRTACWLVVDSSLRFHLERVWGDSATLHKLDINVSEELTRLLLLLHTAQELGRSNSD